MQLITAIPEVIYLESYIVLGHVTQVDNRNIGTRADGNDTKSGCTKYSHPEDFLYPSCFIQLNMVLRTRVQRLLPCVHWCILSETIQIGFSEKMPYIDCLLCAWHRMSYMLLSI